MDLKDVFCERVVGLELVRIVFNSFIFYSIDKRPKLQGTIIDHDYELHSRCLATLGPNALDNE